MKKLFCAVLVVMLVLLSSFPVYALYSPTLAGILNMSYQWAKLKYSSVVSSYPYYHVYALDNRFLDFLFVFSMSPDVKFGDSVFFVGIRNAVPGYNEDKVWMASGNLNSNFTWNGVRLSMGGGMPSYNYKYYISDYGTSKIPHTYPESQLVYVKQPPPPPVNKSTLQSLITQAESLIADDYTPESWNALQAALTPAKALLTGNPSQEDVDAAASSLRSALDGLTEKPPSVSVGELEALIAEAEALDSENYTAGSWSFMDSKLSAARVMLDSTPTQEQIDQAAAELRVAIGSLVATVPPPPSVNIEALQALITQAEGLSSKDYTLNSWSAVSSALSSARSVLYGNPTQARVDEAAQRLQAALDGLQKRPSGGGSPGEIEVPQDIMDAIGSGNVEGLLEIFPSVYLTHATSALPVVIAVFALVVALRAIPKLFKRFVR